MSDVTNSTSQCTMRFAMDIGSTIVKLARIGPDGHILGQEFHPRDFDAGIARQVVGLLEAKGADIDRDEILMSSSANGGLQVGIVCLSPEYSGSVVRSQVLLAGANPKFLDTLDGEASVHTRVDLLIVTGGVDCPDADPLVRRLAGFDAAKYRFGSLMYAGNQFARRTLLERWPEAIVVENPLGISLRGRHRPSVFEAVRRAYLDDLIFKEGVSELPEKLRRGIRPTPEVANSGFQQALANQSSIPVLGPCLLLDIGGATTDLHFATELVRDDSPERLLAGTSVGRHVFTDLGIFASRDSLLMQLRAHPRLYELLVALKTTEAREIFRGMREDVGQPPPDLLPYGCLFLALERFASGHGPGLPTADPSRIAQVMLTGGAAQALDEQVAARVIGLVTGAAQPAPAVTIDRQYSLWVEGILSSKSPPEGVGKPLRGASLATAGAGAAS